MSTKKGNPDDEPRGLGNADLRYEAWSQEGVAVVDEPRGGMRRRARELGVPFGPDAPGPHNAITDVDGVRVGHTTIVHGEGRLEVGKGPARTGVTAIVPPGNIFMDRLAAGGFVLNGAGEMTGFIQAMEWGLLETPVVLTNTLAVGAVSDAVVRALIAENPGIGREHDTVLPVVGECDDSWLSDIAGRHVREAHVLEALARAASGPVAEGTVGSGSGMITFDFAGGIGTSSRRLSEREGGFTVGVLVQSNFGRLQDLRMGGVPLGGALAGPFRHVPKRGGTYGSIIVVIATDAPLLPQQLQRVSKRAALGIGRTGSYAGHASGEIIFAFSTANTFARTNSKRVNNTAVLSDEHIDPIFRATADATEEAILNAICMGADTLGANNHLAPALPLDRVAEILAAVTPHLRPT